MYTQQKNVTFHQLKHDITEKRNRQIPFIMGNFNIPF